MTGDHASFPAPVEALLNGADAACAAAGARLTPLRRQVLGLVLESPQPIGAYALLDRLKASRTGAAPPTVYRALGFLLEHGFVHKVERLNAFVACGAAHDHEGHAHPAQLLVCSTCHAVTELDDHAVAHAIARAAGAAGFRPARATVEVEGTCARCARRQAA